MFSHFRPLGVLAALTAISISGLPVAHATEENQASDPAADAALEELQKSLEESRPKVFDDDSYKLPDTPSALDAARLAREAADSLSLNGVPLSPAILGEFTAPRRGVAPVALELNLLDLARNRYAAKFTALPAATPGAPRATVVMSGPGKVLRYQKLGRLKSGAWVVRQESFSVATGHLPCAILLLRAAPGTVPVTESKETVVTVSGRKPAVLLRCVGYLKLADRDRRVAKLDADTVLLSDPFTPDAKPIRLDLSATP